MTRDHHWSVAPISVSAGRSQPTGPWVYPDHYRHLGRRQGRERVFRKLCLTKVHRKKNHKLYSVPDAKIVHKREHDVVES